MIKGIYLKYHICRKVISYISSVNGEEGKYGHGTMIAGAAVGMNKWLKRVNWDINIK